MNCLSAAEQMNCADWADWARPLPARTETPKTRPHVASAVADSRFNLTGSIIVEAAKLRPSLIRGSPRRFTRSDSAVARSSEDERAVRDRPPHADPVVDAYRHVVLWPNEEADRRHALEERPAEIPHRALRIAAVPHLGIDPHLLQLHRGGRPGRRLRLEADHVLLHPDPRAAFLDLRPGAPAESL